MKYQQFETVDVLKSKLDALRPLPQEVIEQIRADMRIKFTYHSNAIEGNTLTLSETKAVLEDGITISGKPLREHLEAVGYSHAIDYLEALVQEHAPLTDKTVRELHSLILRGTDPTHAGKYRNLNVIISGANHIPPSAERVVEEMEAFFSWYQSHKSAFHPLEFAAKIHAKFVNIHPFKDGNGRTARLIMNLEAMKHGYPTLILPVEERSRYYQCLDLIATNDEYEPFLALIADISEKSFSPYRALMNF